MTYHVFLSFGEDTRKNFTDHLYTALSGGGFRTFRDDDGMERGKNVKLELDQAIKEARSSIVVFSEDYASSGWRLDELVMILKRMRSSGARHVVLPVFYDVDPSQVRKQTGSFGESFCRHEERLNEETNEQKKEYLREKVQVWKRALKEIADLAGMVLQNQADGHEAKFIQKIVREIRNKLNRHVLHVAHNLIGIEFRARNIISWLQDDQSNVGIAVICGMGGIGKTTIAKFVYNLNIERFEARSFLANIGEISQGPKGLVRLQRQLLEELLKRKEKIWNVDEGINKIKNVIHCKRVLVVLDDVDDRAQFDAIIGMLDWFHPGSKIILTTRNTHLLKGNEVDETFKVVELGFDESLELFSWHAFGQKHPIEGYTELSRRVIQHCGGLPLALEVLGSTLSDHSLDIWEDTLQKLADIPHSKILKKLQISYDYLDDNDKELFLHIACFFIGKGKDFVARILGDLYPTVGIQTLRNRCLLTINGRNKLMMHQLLQQMGREIVRQESPKEPGKRSRLWHHKDSFKVLSEKTGTETIEGLCLDMHHVLAEDSHHVMEKDSLFKENFGFSKVKHPCFEELNHDSSIAEYGYSLKRHCLSLFKWRPTNKIERSSDQVELTTDAFTRMRNLKLLQLDNVDIKGRYADFPGGLICLTWHGFPLKSIPTEFSLKKLIGLDLRYSKLEHVWKGKMFLTSLKILNLSHSYCLKKTPNFIGVPNLEKLVLKYCLSLVEVHETIGKLRSLVSLNLKGCENLKKLPKEIGHLTSLEKLILSGCSKLDELPAELRQMKSITVLYADGISQDVGEDGSSKVLNQRKSSKILPSLPGTLVKLSLSNCNLSSDDLVKWLGSFSVLKNLDLSNNPISSLPESIKGLAVLQSLQLRDCKRLQSLPELPTTLKMLNVSGCMSLNVLPSFPNPLEGYLVTWDCEIDEIKGMLKLEPLQNVDSEIISEMGLSSELETMGSLEMDDFFFYDSWNGVFPPLQVLYECGTYNIFLPGSEVPGSWWSNNKTMGSSLTFNVPSLSNHKIQALKIYIVFGYFPRGPEVDCIDGYNYIRVSNKTKRLKWAYSPWLYCSFPDDDRNLVWLSYWKMGNQLILEAGDEVNVSVGSTFDKKCLVNEIGVEIVHDEREDKGSQHHKTYSSHQDVTPVGDLSRYQVMPGHYLLCNMGYPGALDSDDDVNPVGIIFGGVSDSEEDIAESDEESGCSDDESGRSDEESGRSDEESGRSDEESGRSDEESGRSDDESGRSDEESGRSDEESAWLTDEESGRRDKE